MSGENGNGNGNGSGTRKAPRRRRKVEAEDTPVAAPVAAKPPPVHPNPQKDPDPPPPGAEEQAAAIVAGLWQQPGLSVERLIAGGKELEALGLSKEQLTMLAAGVPASTSGLTAQRCQRVSAMLVRLATS